MKKKIKTRKKTTNFNRLIFTALKEKILLQILDRINMIYRIRKYKNFTKSLRIRQNYFAVNHFAEQ